MIKAEKWVFGQKSVRRALPVGGVGGVDGRAAASVLRCPFAALEAAAIQKLTPVVETWVACAAAGTTKVVTPHQAHHGAGQNGYLTF